MTPKQRIVLASVLISLASTTVCWLLVDSISINRLLAIFLAISIVSFAVISVFTKRYVTDRLLPIYRTMFGTNSKKLQQHFDSTKDSIDSAEKETMDWADQRIEEIRNLQEKDDYRKEFIGNLAHELKTPLFNIQGYVNSLLEGAMEDERVREKFLEKANKNVDRMVRIIEDLDTISHLEIDRLELEKSPINIVQCAQEVLESLEIMAAERSVKLHMNERDPIFVQGNEFKLSQVFTNLISNAIAYGRLKGNVHVIFTDLTDRILIEVVDDGPGIDPMKLPRIFERFYRVDKSRSRDVGGSGLGLSIVKHILKRMGRRLGPRVHWVKGADSAFTLDKAK